MRFHRLRARLFAATLAILFGGKSDAADILDLGSTDIAVTEKTRTVDSVTPSYGTCLGGTRLSIIGEGFATEFFDGSNTVWIVSGDFSSDDYTHDGYVQCDVIEGACTVRASGLGLELGVDA